MTDKSATPPSFVLIVSAIPGPTYCSFGSPLKSLNGNTATTGVCAETVVST